LAKDGQTEKATPKKREDSRKEGRVLKSKDFNTLMGYGAFFIIIIFLAEYGLKVLLVTMKTGLEMVALGAEPKEIFIKLMLISSPMILVVWILTTFFTLIGHLVQVGFLFSPKIISPKVKNINPANYFQNLANVKKSGFELAKNLIMFIIMGAIIYNVFASNESEMKGALFLSWFDSLLVFKDILTEFVVKMGLVFLILGVVDYFYQKYEYEESLKMKKQEVKDEHKDAQGNPEMKNQQRMMGRRMMEKQVKSQVLDAQMVIVNPTHYAVVVRYKKKKGDAIPRVILKGVDEKALVIKELAKEYKIPIVENKPLARRMYAELKEDDYISDDMYEIVGKILAGLVHSKKTKID
jgi:flagellar biosynthetic protein FlhB